MAAGGTPGCRHGASAEGQRHRASEATGASFHSIKQSF